MDSDPYPPERQNDRDYTLSSQYRIVPRSFDDRSLYASSVQNLLQLLQTMGHELHAQRTENARLQRENEHLRGLHQRFVETASHQIRTPLTVIQTGAGIIERILAQQKIDAPRTLPYFERIYTAVRDVVNNVDALLGITSVNNDRFANPSVDK